MDATSGDMDATSRYMDATSGDIDWTLVTLSGIHKGHLLTILVIY